MRSLAEDVLILFIVVLTGDATVGMPISYFNFDLSCVFLRQKQAVIDLVAIVAKPNPSVQWDVDFGTSNGNACSSAEESRCGNA